MLTIIMYVGKREACIYTEAVQPELSFAPSLQLYVHFNVQRESQREVEDKIVRGWTDVHTCSCQTASDTQKEKKCEPTLAHAIYPPQMAIWAC